MWIAFPVLLLKFNVCPSLYAASVLKLFVLEEKSFNMEVMKRIINQLSGAFIDGILQKGYEEKFPMGVKPEG